MDASLDRQARTAAPQQEQPLTYPFEVHLGRSCICRVLTSGLEVAALGVALWQSVRLEVPWPLLALVVGVLLTRRLVTLAPDRIRLLAQGIEVATAAGMRGAEVGRFRALTPLALEFELRWASGGRDHLIIWRDAVTEAEFRRLSRWLRLDAPSAPVARQLLQESV